MYSELVTQRTKNHQLTDNQIILPCLEDDKYSDSQISILAYFSEKPITFIKALPTSINKNARSTYVMIIEENTGISLAEAERRIQMIFKYKLK
jgi:hypothetical protein